MLKTILFIWIASAIQGSIIYGIATKGEFDEGAGTFIYIGLILAIIEAWIFKI